MDLFQLVPPSLLDQSFGLCISPQDLILPSYNYHRNNYYRPWNWYVQRADKDVGSTLRNGKDKFQIALDVQHFQPNEITVKVVDRDVVIEGKHEERTDNHGFISRQFKRRYLLPLDCNPDSVISTLSSDGVLMVTANKIKETQQKETVVHIQSCDTCPNKEIKAKLENKDLSKDNPKCNIASTRQSKKGMELMLKEDHCCLLKPELLGSPLIPGFEKSSASTLKEADESLKIKSQKIGDATVKTSKESDVSSDTEKVQAKVSDVLSAKMSSSSASEEASTCQQADTIACGITSEIVTEKEEISAASTSEMCSRKNTFNETIQVQETSSYSSTMASNIKETTEKINEIVSDISAQLKEAAENI